MAIDDDRRALSEGMLVAIFSELRPGDRVHFNSGWPRTSWTAEVRSRPIDDEVVVVVKRIPPYAGRLRYALLTRIELEVYKVRSGPIPRALCKRDPGDP